MGSGLSTAQAVGLGIGVATVVTGLVAAVHHLLGRVRSLEFQLSQEKNQRTKAENRASQEEGLRRGLERRLAVARRRQPVDAHLVEALRAAAGEVHNYLAGGHQQEAPQQPDPAADPEIQPLNPRVAAEHAVEQIAAILNNMQQIDN